MSKNRLFGSLIGAIAWIFSASASCSDKPAEMKSPAIAVENVLFTFIDKSLSSDKMLLQMGAHVWGSGHTLNRRDFNFIVFNNPCLDRSNLDYSTDDGWNDLYEETLSLRLSCGLYLEELAPMSSSDYWDYVPPHSFQQCFIISRGNSKGLVCVSFREGHQVERINVTKLTPKGIIEFEKWIATNQGKLHRF